MRNTCRDLFITTMDSLSFSCRDISHAAMMLLYERTYHIGDDARQQKILLMFVRTFLQKN